METNFSIPEFFYDLIAILFPGIFTLGVGYLIFPEILVSLIETYPYLNNIFIFLFIAYIIGHISYSLSSEIIAPTFNFLSGNPTKTLLGKEIKKRQKNFNKYFLREVIEHDDYFTKNVKKGIEKYTDYKNFDFSKGENIDIGYEFCRNFIVEKASKNYTSIRKEQSYGELSRSIILITLLFAIGMIITQIISGSISFFWIKLGINLIVLLSFVFRYGQARHTAPIFIFSTFCTFLEVSNFEQKENKKQKNKKKAKK